VSAVKEVRSVANACAVVDAIAAAQPVGVSELARLTGLDKSATQRILITLHSAGWLRPAAGASIRWELSSTFARLARASGTSLAATMRPVMERLRDDTDETVLLAVLDGDRLVVEEAVESLQPVRMATTIGATLPIAGSASARVLAAHMRPEELAEFRSRHLGFNADKRALAAVRRRGWASNEGETNRGVFAVAAAVLSDVGEPLGALVVSGPGSRMGPTRMRHHGRLAADAADRRR
jgi:IclR family acetate operon transcriptional repressor